MDEYHYFYYNSIMKRATIAQW